MSDQQQAAKYSQIAGRILEVLILSAILNVWNVQGKLQDQQGDQKTTTVELKAQVIGMREAMTSLQGQLSGVPALSQSMARIEVKLDEHERRLSRIENNSGIRP